MYSFSSSLIRLTSGTDFGKQISLKSLCFEGSYVYKYELLLLADSEEGSKLALLCMPQALSAKSNRKLCN